MQPFDFKGPHRFRRRRHQRHQPRHRRGLRAKPARRLAVLSRSQEKVDAATHRLQQLRRRRRWASRRDVRNADATAAALKATHDALGDIDILVSGAAGNFPAPALGMSANGFKSVIDIDLLGTFNVLRGAHAFLRKPGAIDREHLGAAGAASVRRCRSTSAPPRPASTCSPACWRSNGAATASGSIR